MDLIQAFYAGFVEASGEAFINKYYKIPEKINYSNLAKVFKAIIIYLGLV